MTQKQRRIIYIAGTAFALVAAISSEPEARSVQEERSCRWSTSETMAARLRPPSGEAVAEVHQQACRTWTSQDRLKQLSQSPSPSIRIRVAENSSTPAIVLRYLATDPCSEVRIAVGGNPSTPPSILGQLAGDQNADVRFAMAELLDAPYPVLVSLAQDQNPYVSARAEKTLSVLSPHLALDAS